MSTRSRDEFFRALSGRGEADPTGARGTGLTGQLLAAFGASPRDPSRPNTSAAAKALGVTQRTVQRWIATGDRQRQRPREQTMKKITTRARQAVTTKRGRQRSIATRAASLSKTGMRLSLTGMQGPERGPDYERFRTVAFDFDPQLAQSFMSAYIAGGDAAARRFLIEHAPELYNMPTWTISDVHSIHLSGPYGIN